MPFVSSYEKSFSGTSSFPRSYGSGYSSYERKPSWERPSSLYSTSDSSYSKPSYSTSNVYMASRSSNNLSSSPAYSWRDSIKTDKPSYEKPSRFGEERTNLYSEKPSRLTEDRLSYQDKVSRFDTTKPSYSWRDNLRTEKPSYEEKPKYSEDSSSKPYSWRDSYRSDKTSYEEKPVVESKPAYSWRDSLRTDKGLESSNVSKAQDILDDNRLSRTLERRASKKETVPGYESALQRTLDRSSNISERIEQTLSKHNASSYQEPSVWRTREQSTARTDSQDPSRSKYLQDRGTSPESDVVQVSRIGRDSEPYSVRLTKYVNPVKQDIGLQTEQYYLKKRSEADLESFDYFDHVKKTMQYITNNPVEKQKLEERIELFNSTDKEEKFSYKKAGMTGFLPNQEPASTPKSYSNGVKEPEPLEERKPFRYSDRLHSSNSSSGYGHSPVPTGFETLNGNSTSDTSNVTNTANGYEPEYSSRKKQLSQDPLSYLDSMDLDSDKEEEEVKPPDKVVYEYETNTNKKEKDDEEEKEGNNEEEEEEEEEEGEKSGEVLNGRLEIGIKIDDPKPSYTMDKHEEQEKQNETNTFIGATVDIDDLLSRTSHFFAYDGSPVEFEQEATVEDGEINETNEAAGGDLSTNPKPKHSSKYLDDAPWWENKKDEDEEKEEVEHINEEEESEQKPTKNEDYYEEDGVEEEEEDEEEDEEEEGEEEGDWEYYYSDNDERPEEEQFESVKEEIPNQEEKDEKEGWIMDCMKQIIPSIPTKPAKKVEDSDDSDDQDYANFDEIKVVENVYSEYHGYRDWLKDATVEIGKEPLLQELEPSDLVSPQDLENPQTENKMKTKAKNLVQKLNESDDTALKQVLFSLKSLFQSESDLVYEFVEEGGLTRLVDLGINQDESQLQNFVLRALGQLMLYVDGMKGVMEHISAIELLYKLISSQNKLVVKTAIKLLLVFIDYNESNYLILLQAINNVATQDEGIPWSYLIKLMTNEKFDPELATFALTLVNKTLYEIDDQNTFYEQTDYMEDLGIEYITEMTSDDNFPNSLLEEIQLYNVALKQEDGEQVTEEDISALYQDSSLRLRTSLRTKTNSYKPRKSLRYKISQVKNAEADNQGDIEEVGFNDLKRILAKNGLPVSPSGDSLNQLTESLTLSGFLQKAKDAFIAKISKGETGSPVPPESPQPDEREGELQWQQIQTKSDRPLIICDLDFTDLKYEEEEQQENKNMNGVPVPPPLPPPAPPKAPPPPGAPGLPTPLPMVPKDKTLNSISNYRKTKKTIKLFWRELRQRQDGINTVWDELLPISVDHKVLEYLFESRGKETIVKETSKIQTGPIREIVVLEHKRSNFINIGMTKLPPPRIIKESVMKMDSSIINKEGIEKLLTMLPSEEEISRIEEAQEQTPELPLGTAEQFLITLSSISGLEARLRLWAFKLDFVVVEKEICEPLGDLKQGLDILKSSVTFNAILSVILEIGNFLNGTESKGFQIDYLAKVTEVKDTVHKHSMMYHLTFWLLESIPNLSDLYSEIGPVTRASKTDFEELSSTLIRMEEECKSAWDYLKIITKFDTSHGDGEGGNKNKISEFLTDAAERIIVMQKINKILKKSFQEFLIWLGIPKSQTHEFKVNHVCKTISEFALEFRTSRERAQQTLKFKREAKERNRSRVKLHELVKNSSKGDLNLLLGEIDAPRKKKKHREHRRRREEKDEVEVKEPRERRHREDGEHRERRRREKEESLVSRLDGARSREDVDIKPVLPSPSDETEGVGRVEHRRRRRREDIPLESTLPAVEPEEKEKRRKKKVSRNVSEQTVQLMNGQSIPETEVDAGLFQSLMDMGRVKLRRNGERRRSTKVRESSLCPELMRSRTRENTDRLLQEPD